MLGTSAFVLRNGKSLKDFTKEIAIFLGLVEVADRSFECWWRFCFGPYFRLSIGRFIKY